MCTHVVKFCLFELKCKLHVLLCLISFMYSLLINSPTSSHKTHIALTGATFPQIMNS